MLRIATRWRTTSGLVLALTAAVVVADMMGGALHIGVARQVLAASALRIRSDDADSTVAGVLAYLHDVQDSGAWSLLEGVAIRWANDGRLDDAAVVLGYLERHDIRHSMNVRARPGALDRATAGCADRLRDGASLIATRSWTTPRRRSTGSRTVPIEADDRRRLLNRAVDNERTSGYLVLNQ